MKKLIIILFILGTSHVFSQKIKFEKKYFLLGTLNDYIGRYQFSKNKEVIESYSLHEKPLVDKISSLYKETNISLDTIKKQYFLRDKTLNDSINSFYIFDNYQLTYPNKDTIHKGKLKHDIFKTNDEKISFLLGCMSRYSYNNMIKLKEKEFCIQFANSISKVSITQNIIKELGFTINKIENLKNIPTINRIYFTVTDSYYNIFKEYNLLSIEMQKNVFKYYSR